jgi:hypothetical protein
MISDDALTAVDSFETGLLACQIAGLLVKGTARAVISI